MYGTVVLVCRSGASDRASILGVHILHTYSSTYRMRRTCRVTLRALALPALPVRRRSKMTFGQFRLFFACTLVALVNLILLFASSLALLRVLRAAAQDAYSSPRRRLLSLDDGVARRSPNRVTAVLGACRPWTTQKALLAMVALTAAREWGLQ